MHAAAPRADFLLVDLGNTFSKFQLADAHPPRRGDGLLGPRRQLLTAALNPASLIALLDRWRYRRVALCSVVPAAAEIIHETLAEPVLTLRPGLRRTPAQFAGVDLSLYPRRKSLGPDRLALLAGAMARHAPGPMLVVSLGTAATFDALDADGRFLGGAIAPGPDALANAVQRRTALLPMLAFPTHAYGAHPPPALGLSTRDALRSAAFHGWRGMVKEILQALCREHAGRLGPHCPEDTKVIATGGVAPRLAQDVPELKTLDPDLLFAGLLAIARAGGLSARRPGGHPARRGNPGNAAAADDAPGEGDGSPRPLPDDGLTLPLAGLEGVVASAPS